MSDLNLFNSIPNEILIEIFELLPSADLGQIKKVCKQFLLIANNKKITDRLVVFIPKQLAPLFDMKTKCAIMGLKNEEGQILLFRQEILSAMRLINPTLLSTLEQNTHKSLFLPFCTSLEDFKKLDEIKLDQDDISQPIIQGLSAKKCSFKNLVAAGKNFDNFLQRVNAKAITWDGLFALCNNNLEDLADYILTYYDGGIQLLGLEGISSDEFKQLKKINPTDCHRNNEQSISFSIQPDKFLALYLFGKEKYPNLKNMTEIPTHTFKINQQDPVRENYQHPEILKQLLDDVVLAYNTLTPDEQDLFNLYAMIGLEFDEISEIKEDCNSKIMPFLQEVLPFPLYTKLTSDTLLSKDDKKIIRGFLEQARSAFFMQIVSPKKTNALKEIFEMTFQTFQISSVSKVLLHAYNLDDFIRTISFTLASNSCELLPQDSSIFKEDDNISKLKQIIIELFKDLEFYPEKARKALQLVQAFASNEKNADWIEKASQPTDDPQNTDFIIVQDDLPALILFSAITNTSPEKIFEFFKENKDRLDPEENTSLPLTDILLSKCIDGKITTFEELKQAVNEQEDLEDQGKEEI